MPFLCSICEEESTRICVRCTKDSCNNHLCERCRRCSDCCECEVRLAEPSHDSSAEFHSVADLKAETAEPPEDVPTNPEPREPGPVEPIPPEFPQEPPLE